MLKNLQPWESLMKRIVWLQLGEITNKKILDFGSGIGVTADYLAGNNEVIAIELSEESVNIRWTNNEYQQLIGSTEKLREFEDETFDMIICHNVLEYAADREDIVREFARLLKAEGTISILKHNRSGRVMQMVVLLNDFDSANNLLDGNDGMASKYGAIRYYEDADIEKWCSNLKITKTLGMRTFWDMQQNQEIHKDADWQDKMIQIEMRVSDMEGYKDIAFLHHLTIEKILSCSKVPMTKVYFVRHAQPEHNHADDKTRPLTEEGKADAKIVLEFLKDKKVDAFYSSPYKRSMDTIADTAAYFEKEMITDERLREREKGPDGNNYGMFQKRWADHNYHEEGGESIAIVQERNITALNDILSKDAGKNIVVGTHGTALGTILNFYDNSYGCDDFLGIIDKMPYVIELDFEGNTLISKTEHVYLEKEFKGKKRADKK